MLPINGYLRDTVLVQFMASGVELRFSVWSIELPTKLFESSEKLTAFFRREISSSELGAECSDVRKLITLLSHQGCLIHESVKNSYHLTEVKSLYVSFCNESYGRYYAHDLWAAMRSNEIPIPIIRQWISRTYFLSRFAGVTASAASLSGTTPEIISAFLKSAIEEYSHCEDYYYPPTSLFPPNLGYLGGIAPAPCFIAFDQQMLRIAQQDWLAHIFVALFQERTAQFRDGAHRLYSRIEKQLCMPDLFNGWRTHISFDEDNSHEGDLDDLFDQDILVSYNQLQHSFDEASLAIDLLIDGLEVVLHLGDNKKNPRAEVSNNIVLAHHLEGIRCLSEINKYTIKAINPCDLVVELIKLVASTPNGVNFLSNASVFVSSQIEHSLIRLSAKCLELCDTQDEIISLGNILEAGLKAGLVIEVEATSLEKARRVVWNFLSRKVGKPSNFVFTILFFQKLVEEGARLSGRPNEFEPLESLTDPLEFASHSLCRPEQIIDYVNEALFSIALIEYAHNLEYSGCSSIRFKVGHNN